MMHIRGLKQLAAGLAIGCACGTIFAAAATQPWVKDEATLEPGAQIYLGTEFAVKKGKFKAMPESMLDTKNSIEGSFVVANYRYVYQKPIKDQSGKMFDELISTELLDCERQFYGTLKQVRRRNGSVVSETSTRDADVLMTQISSVNLGSKLCDLHAKQPVQPLVHQAVNNPAYNPHPSDKDIDALIDHRMPAKKDGVK